MSMNKLIDSKKKIKTINNKNIDVKEGNDNVIQEPLTFEEKYKRVTTYVEIAIHEKIEDLYKRRVIKKKTHFVNEAFKEYLNKTL